MSCHGDTESRESKTIRHYDFHPVVSGLNFEIFGGGGYVQTKPYANAICRGERN